jgi:hypothetical protein
MCVYQVINMACSPSTSHHWDIPPRQFTGLFTTHPMGTPGMVGLGQPEGLVSIPSSSTPQLSLASILEEGQLNDTHQNWSWKRAEILGANMKYWTTSDDKGKSCYRLDCCSGIPLGSTCLVQSQICFKDQNDGHRKTIALMGMNWMNPWVPID